MRIDPELLRTAANEFDGLLAIGNRIELNRSELHERARRTGRCPWRRGSWRWGSSGWRSWRAGRTRCHHPVHVFTNLRWFVGHAVQAVLQDKSRYAAVGKPLRHAQPFVVIAEHSETTTGRHDYGRTVGFARLRFKDRERRPGNIPNERVRKGRRE